MKTKLFFSLCLLLAYFVSFSQDIVINKLYNSGVTSPQGQDDVVELLVVKDFMDARSLVIKDFTGGSVSATELTDNGGKFRFKDVAFWRTLRAGTLIIIRVLPTQSGYVQDTDPTDKVLDIRLDNTAYFSNEGGTPFNIQNYDMVMLKTGNIAGVDNAVHAAAFGIPLSNTTYLGVTSPKMYTDKMSPTGGTLYAKNLSESISDFNGEDTFYSTTTSPTTITWGTGTGAGNIAFISYIRNLSDYNYVHREGNETIAGTKTFSGTVNLNVASVQSTPTANDHIVAKKYVDDAIAGFANLSGSNTYTDYNSFSSSGLVVRDKSDIDRLFFGGDTGGDIYYTGAHPLSIVSANSYIGLYGSTVEIGGTLSKGGNTYTLPFSSGTLALTSQLSDVNGKANLVGYNMFTGSQNISGQLILQDKHNVDRLYIGGDTGGEIYHTGDQPLSIAAANSYISLYSSTVEINGTLSKEGNTYTLPSSSGTLALRSEIPTNTGDLNNNAGFITLSGIGDKENISNKVTSLNSPDDTRYPTTQAVSTALGGKVNIDGTNASGTWGINISGSASTANTANGLKGLEFNAAGGYMGTDWFMVYDNPTQQFRLTDKANIKAGLAYSLQDITSVGSTTTNIIHANGVGANIKLGGVTNSGGLFQSPSGDNLIYLSNWTDNTKSLALNPVNGNVGIGIASAQEKLAVNGKIRAREVKVEPGSNNWPDYVFEEGYKPLSLAEISTFVKQHKHLPEVPSAKEVEQNGLELGEMNKILLKKVEELTLHLIEKEKQLNALEERIIKLEKRE